MTIIRQMKRDISQVGQVIESSQQRFNSHREHEIMPIIRKGLEGKKLWPEDIELIAAFVMEAERFTNLMAKSAKLSAINYEALRGSIIETNSHLDETLDDLNEALNDLIK